MFEESARFDLRVEKQWPAIAWRAPLLVQRPGDGEQRLGCRFCLGQFGIKGKDVMTCEYLFDEIVEFEKHMQERHQKNV